MRMTKVVDKETEVMREARVRTSASWRRTTPPPHWQSMAWMPCGSSGWWHTEPLVLTLGAEWSVGGSCGDSGPLLMETSGDCGGKFVVGHDGFGVGGLCEEGCCARASL